MKPSHSKARTSLVKIAKIHVLIGIFFVIQIIVYDSGMLITPEIVLRRWVAATIFIVGAAAVWYLARINKSPEVVKNLMWFLIVLDLVLASFYVYGTRGMASRGVFLFILPILVSAILARKGVIYLTSVLAVCAYTVTAISYFVINFNEGYKLELYGEIGLWSAMLLATGWISWALVRQRS